MYERNLVPGVDIQEPIDIEEQILETRVREGFTVVEWGGSEVE